MTPADPESPTGNISCPMLTLEFSRTYVVEITHKKDLIYLSFYTNQKRFKKLHSIQTIQKKRQRFSSFYLL